MKINNIIMTMCLVLFWSLNAQADQEKTYKSEKSIIFTQPSGKGTGNDIWVELTKDGLDKVGQESQYMVGTCVTSVKSWNDAGDHTPALMLYSSNWARHAMLTGVPCLPKKTGNVKVFSSTRSPWYLCKNQKTSKSFGSNNVTFGMVAKHHPMNKIVNDINTTNNWSWKPIDVVSSVNAYTLLENSEIDYALIAAAFATKKINEQSNVKCIASWKKQDTLPYFLDLVKMQGDVSTIFYFTQIVIGKNLSERQIDLLKNIYDAKKNKKFASWLEAQPSENYIPTDSKKFMQNFYDSTEQAAKLFPN